VSRHPLGGPSGGTIGTVGSDIEKNARYERLVPKRHLRSSGLRVADLGVRDAWHRPFNFVKAPDGGAVRIQPSALCVLDSPSGPIAFLVDVKQKPELAEAVLMLGSLFFTGNRTQRYMTLYKIYEILEPSPSIDYAALRHALSHASVALSRPKTKAKLLDLFGTTKIDLSRSSHIRVFYRQLVQLLFEVDRKLFGVVMAHAADLWRLDSDRDALHDWQIDGIPGIHEPIPVVSVDPRRAT
jgi:hypothetical protein